MPHNLVALIDDRRHSATVHVNTCGALRRWKTAKSSALRITDKVSDTWVIEDAEVVKLGYMTVRHNCGLTKEEQGIEVDESDEIPSARSEG